MRDEWWRGGGVEGKGHGKKPIHEFYKYHSFNCLEGMFGVEIRL